MGWRRILRLDYGIVQGPLGPDICGPELVAAVANAGAVGILRAPDWEGLVPLLPRVVDLVSDAGIPVIAAGGIVDGRGHVAALALGADGVCLGTRFLATTESFAHPLYKRSLVELDKTEYTNIFGRSRSPGAPHRVLQAPFFSDWKNLPDHENEDNQLVIGHTVVHGREKEIRRFAGTVPNATTTGDIQSMVMYAGQAVGLIKEILPAGEVVRRLVGEAQQIIQKEFSHD